MVQYRRLQVDNGWVSLQHDEDGVWRISWEPNEGHADWPGHTFAPTDPDLPADYPGADDPDALMAWGIERWRHA